MTITLNHTIVPARDKAASAKFFADIFGVKRGRATYFAPVKINKSLTLLFDEEDKFESHHLAFHVSNKEFDAIFGRIKAARSLSVARRGVSTTASSTIGAAAAAFISAIRTDTCSS